MSISDVLFIVPGHPAVSVIAWMAALAVSLYLARGPAHRAITSLSEVLHYAFRIAAQSTRLAEEKLAQRNREVLLAAGREASERIIEREFDRVDATLRRDLAEYPALHRQLTEQIQSIDEDYQHSTQIPPDPPSPPGWVKAVESVAKIPSQGDPMVANILGDIHKSLLKAQNNAIEQYRKTSHERHVLLKGMMPHWRRLLQVMGQVDKGVNRLIERSKTIDRHMDEYEQITRGTDRAVRMLSSSSITQFFIAAFVLAIAIGGAVINFHLIARPMSEMVGGTSQIMGFKTANIAALVIILVEIAMGLFLMESLRITRLFPVIGALDDKTRVRMVYITFAILFALAGIEAGLAYMRELLSQGDAALVAYLMKSDQAQSAAGQGRWITTAAQMGMGFILPFALTFVAIALESFVQSLRTVLGITGVGLLRAMAFLLRLLGNVSRYAGVMLVHMYDVLIFAPLWVEQQVRGGDNSEPVPQNPEHGKDEDEQPLRTAVIGGPS
ncbi:MAG TPA: hypothetical protein VKA13_01950 [Gammaproteobacteria bacterium]|nr:hypothetical protein [Gammaproteobacteria bacterium]